MELITWALDAALSSASATNPEQLAPSSASAAVGSAADADAEYVPERVGSASALALPEEVPWPAMAFHDLP